eukprot:TRINITY_DN46284_c0_g1_i7.p1 TRINITY_DN46284_c0_g1~~TRINITY_DN46284_c0_g1_i7.p1  ORF type:complete len:398 (+),score=72.04 TRINITY_DN46284_c0_g1_i7:30-1196(+)
MSELNFQLALQELLLCEQGIQLCTPSIAQCVDNIALILLDLVWCSYKLQDVNQLGVSITRLAQVRKILDKQYSEERLIKVYGSTMMVAPVYLRLEMLEGMAAYYAGEKKVANDKLTLAKRRWDQLQVLPEDSSELLGMGFEPDEIVRALRLAGRDKSRALELIMRHREEKKALKERESQRKRQAKFGRTKDGNYVDLQYIDRLGQLGYSEPLAAEALRINENDFEKALDLLCDPNLLKQSKMKKILDKELADFAGSVTSEMLPTLPSTSNDPSSSNAAEGMTRQLEDQTQIIAENVTNPNHDIRQDSIESQTEIVEGIESQTEIVEEIDDQNESEENTEPQSSNVEDFDMEDLFQKIQEEEPLNIYFENLDDEIEVIMSFLSSLESDC